ncbi:Alpha/Beta hydrolase protein [Kockovaella imperatae]|uniref:Alpha/Beta hydrolase protein n=1 Tax=Kockovaella imperatae TaxID=4999 RepID=A0A1Y1UPL2_9TREE|nr:Alpha/Beta hydrolase protein [Kockovaella imperatae]ORX39406.1 Alpha/Beta hydrolase protein [Kockovaella imperatae]
MRQRSIHRTSSSLDTLPRCPGHKRNSTPSTGSSLLQNYISKLVVFLMALARIPLVGPLAAIAPLRPRFLNRETKMTTKTPQLTSEAMLAVLLENAPQSALAHRPLLRQIYLYSNLALTLALLPLWTLRYAHPSWRPRKTWSLGTSVRVRVKRDICGLVGACEIDHLGRDLSIDLCPKDLLHSHPITIPPVPADSLRGHPAEMLALLRESAAKNAWTPHIIPRAKNGLPLKKDWLAQQGVQYGPCPVKAFWYAGDKSTPESTLSPIDPSEPVGLYFHGGGYLFGTAAETDLTANIPKRLVTNTSVKRILSVDYRLAAQGPWPLPLIDAISAYKYLLDIGMTPDKIIIFGDSAGGHLAMALTRYLRDEGRHEGMGMPKGLILMSPWSDLGFTHAWGEGRFSNFDSDLVDETFGPFACSLLMRALPFSLVHKSSYLSPASYLIPSTASGPDSMADFPPTCIVYGGAERLSLSILKLWTRFTLARQGAHSADQDLLIEGKDCVHDFLMFPWQYNAGQEAREQMEGWLERLVQRPAQELGQVVDAENSPILVPSWMSLTNSIRNSKSALERQDLREVLREAAMESESSIRQRRTRRKTDQVGEARSGSLTLFTGAVESDEETLVGDGESEASEETVGTLAEETQETIKFEADPQPAVRPIGPLALMAQA